MASSTEIDFRNFLDLKISDEEPIKSFLKLNFSNLIEKLCCDGELYITKEKELKLVPKEVLQNNNIIIGK